MKSIRRKRSNTEDPDLTPALDIVFILLIFFIVTASFQQEKAMLLEPPVPPSPEKPSGQSIVVHLSNDGFVYVDGRLSNMSSVRANISRLRAETPDIGLVIQVDDQVKSSTLLRVRDAAYSAGYRDKVGVLMSETTT